MPLQAPGFSGVGVGEEEDDDELYLFEVQIGAVYFHATQLMDVWVARDLETIWKLLWESLVETHVLSEYNKFSL